jgi:Fe-S-cluster containining protein
MQKIKCWEDILAEVEKSHGFMDMLCSSAAADYCSNGGEIPCGRGCSSCCTLAVNCTACEALLISKQLTEGQSRKLAAYIHGFKQKLPLITSLKNYLKLHRQELGGCPFLENGECGVYEARPLSCRSLLSTKESHWCGADFSELTSAGKQAFVESLDRSAVAFPMHYLAASQDAGRKLEMHAAMQMTKEFGFSLYGSMPVLVYLFKEYDLTDSIEKGADTLLELAASVGFDSQFIFQVEKP